MRRSKCPTTSWVRGARRAAAAVRNIVAWHARLAALPDAQRAEFERVQAGHLPEGWRDVLDDYRKRAVERDEPQPGIIVSGEISDLFAPLLPERMVGCADLEAPTGHKRQLHAFTADDRSGAYVHCGVREHLMGAMANGMAAHGGIVATSVTYLAFSDYQRPAMRMAALMGLPVHYRVQPRLDRRRQERADASAGRDTRLVARDAEHARAASRRRSGSRRMLGARARASARPEHAGVRASGVAAGAPHA